VKTRPVPYGDVVSSKRKWASLGPAISLILVAIVPSAFAAPVPVVADGLRAYSIIPPGQNGFATFADIISGQLPAHTDDQREMYASLVDDNDVTEEELLDYFHSAQFGPGTTIEREYRPNNKSTVYRDGFGIPHVYGDTDEDAAFALGYVAAEDRLFQMDVLRHAARGDLANFLGADYTEYDIELRTDNYTVAEVQGMFDALDDDFGADGALLQDMLTAYSDGVNARMQEVRDDATLNPAEYFSRNLSIEDWAPTDTIYMVVLQLRRFGEGGGEELSHAGLLQKLKKNLGAKAGKRAWGDLVWRDDPNTYATIPAASGTFPSQQFGPVDPDAVAIPAGSAALASSQSATMRSRSFIPTGPSSNFIGVSGTKSSTGHQLERASVLHGD
jgi:hypothetical protein